MQRMNAQRQAFYIPPAQHVAAMVCRLRSGIRPAVLDALAWLVRVAPEAMPNDDADLIAQLHSFVASFVPEGADAVILAGGGGSKEQYEYTIYARERACRAALVLRHLLAAGCVGGSPAPSAELAWGLMALAGDDALGQTHRCAAFEALNHYAAALPFDAAVGREGGAQAVVLRLCVRAAAQSTHVGLTLAALSLIASYAVLPHNRDAFRDSAREASDVMRRAREELCAFVAGLVTSLLDVDAVAAQKAAGDAFQELEIMAAGTAGGDRVRGHRYELGAAALTTVLAVDPARLPAALAVSWEVLPAVVGVLAADRGGALDQRALAGYRTLAHSALGFLIQASRDPEGRRRVCARRADIATACMAWPHAMCGDVARLRRDAEVLVRTLYR
eukprot:TRINITY_DN22452_c0_g1_i1.p1 TRINITY_DN22452_c0_g1~~TRINITY_DN22452_c0_g1_i1.p1  ORF type:complete len:419 (+),score=84.39 TRINITY_DN22452_c0_g1_i1:92-1258(+)